MSPAAWIVALTTPAVVLEDMYNPNMNGNPFTQMTSTFSSAWTSRTFFVMHLPHSWSFASRTCSQRRT
ncbi:hypothetical protein GCM10010485_77150 [Streptosporangium carneum]